MNNNKIAFLKIEILKSRTLGLDELELRLLRELKCIRREYSTPLTLDECYGQMANSP